MDLRDYFDLKRSRLDDVREYGGEVIILFLKEGVSISEAVETLSWEIAKFLQRETGKGYSPSKEPGMGIEWIVREPGHEVYGLKIVGEANRVIIKRVAILEDETFMNRYVRYLHQLAERED
ncbi:MAG: hypothetical protein N2323_00090 [candidate division WOR-3 bacterium]|nr:hypothetical protein [candidate division WOR-3 bacterium]MCX7836347.1 hypothetical protein [candidate division WOR-3 bacterium]MDW8113548.1 hypothetical protein [candidate division WOR-3 bacterium]